MDVGKGTELYKEVSKTGEKRAFALLGDIYLSQGETKEATKWYKEGAKKRILNLPLDRFRRIFATENIL